MGFNKRYVNKHKIIQQYKNHGIEGVNRYLNADALHTGDQWSSNMLDHFYNDNIDIMIKLLDSEQDGKSIQR